MRNILMMGVALSLMAAPAFAQDWDNGGNDKKPITIDAFLAAAGAFNSGMVGFNKAHSANQSTSAYTTSSFDGSKGLMSQAQNAGANSSLQNAISLAYVANTNSSTLGIGAAVAGSENSGSVFGNRDTTGSAKPAPASDVYDPELIVGRVTQSGTINQSFNGSQGVMQSNQNVGDNSLLQNASAVASVTPTTGSAFQLGIALAKSENEGTVGGNTAKNYYTTAASNVSNSFDNSKGVINLNQNSGANSELQNSTAVATDTLKGASNATLAASVALSSNHGGVWCNTATTADGSNASNMSNSFNDSQGVIQASQNAGANSLIQNTVSVGAVN